MTIIGPLPNNIQNGQLADANPVMANFLFLLNQINANAVPSGTLSAPPGTAIPFAQPTAPEGWEAQTGPGFDDAFLRIVIPDNYQGENGFEPASSLIIGGNVTDGHILSVAELPAHTHEDNGHNHGISDPGHSHQVHRYANLLPQSGGDTLCWYSDQFVQSGSSTTGIVINVGNANILPTGESQPHSHTLSPLCKYVDHIVAVKSPIV